MQSHHCNHDDSQELDAYVWGPGEDGIFCCNSKTNRYKPVLLQGLERDHVPGQWSQMAVGYEHSAGVTPKGEFFTWGRENYGRLGHEKYNDGEIMKPKQVRSMIGKATVRHISCSCYITAVVTKKGELLTCGNGEHGQLGHDNESSLSKLTRVEGLLVNHFVSKVACGDYHTVVLTSDGSLWTFGSNKHGRTGHGITQGTTETPRKVEGWDLDLGSVKVVVVAASLFHSACIAEDGSTYTWGRGAYGMLGHGNGRFQSSPKLVTGLVGKRGEEVACGRYHTLVRVEDGRIYSFGNGNYGQLGQGDNEMRSTPTLIEGPLQDETIVQVVCGIKHSMALTRNGDVYTWGRGLLGTLGHGYEGDINRTIPSYVEALNGKKVVQISSHYVHSVALVDSKHQSYVKKMKAMLNDKSCSDLTFVLLENGDSVHAMKGLLIDRSDYFRAMFRSNLRENRENEVHVQDWSKEVLLLFLEYLYCGWVNVGRGMDDALELYALTDRYQEKCLSRQCVKVIRRGLNDENVIPLLLVVDRLGLDVLKDVCMSYVVSNIGNTMTIDATESLSHALREELLILIGKRDQNQK